MKLQQIEIFLELAKELHFWRTAEKMHITQSALSRQVQSLENELGFSLFERSKRRVKLTTAGDYMRLEWQRLFIDIGNIHRRAKQISLGESGTVRIGHPGSITYSFLPDLLAKVSARFPRLKFDLVEASAVDIDHALLSYQIDLGFDRDIPGSEQLSSRPVAQDNFSLFLPENHRFQSEDVKRLADISEEEFILPRLRDGSEYAESLKAIFKTSGFLPNVCIESDFGATILSLVARGLGVSIMPGSYLSASPRASGT